MKWSWRIARIAGIDVYLHSTFLLLIGALTLLPILETRNVAAALGEFVVLASLFGIVVLHELGHALMARQFGIRTRDIILLPIGGVARLERMPEDPKQELLVALAGPAVNVVLAAICFFAFVPVAGLAIFAHSSLLHLGGSFVGRLFWINVALALFNLIPAFPMDGGRVLRALLALRLDYVQATQIAATIGQGVALLFGFLGLFGNFFLLFIALFVWMGAAEEASMVQMKSALGGIPISRAMITEFRSLAPEDTLDRAIQHILAGFQQDFPVLDEYGRLVGVLMRANLMTALAQEGPGARVADVMARQFETADPGEMLDSVFSRLQTCDCRSLPIVRNGQVLGIVTMENLGEFMMIQSALRGARA